MGERSVVFVEDMTDTKTETGSVQNRQVTKNFELLSIVPETPVSTRKEKFSLKSKDRLLGVRVPGNTGQQ